LSEIKEYIKYFSGTEVDELDAEAKNILQAETFPAVLELFKQKVSSRELLDPANAKAILKEITKELKLKGKDVFMPIRIAVTGQMHGPDLDRIIALLGKENIAARLEQTAKQINIS
jgi:nondiscriminating glutamyl-tRNA synthetase